MGLKRLLELILPLDALLGNKHESSWSIIRPFDADISITLVLVALFASIDQQVLFLQQLTRYKRNIEFS